MKNNQTRFVVYCAVVAVLVFVGAVVLRAREVAAPGDAAENGGVGVVGQDGGSGANNASVNNLAQIQTPMPDTVAVSPLTDGDEIVADASAGYYFSMPTNWYVENSAGAGIAVYPDYDPKGDVAPECKIEISAFASGNSGLSDWITNYLHADPTVTVTEISRTPMAIGETMSGKDDGVANAGRLGNAAIEWLGMLNGVTTTLVYAMEPGSSAGSGRNILEIAPSTLSEASDASNDECDFDLQALMANLQFGVYEP